jgi:uncharacterized protein YbcI
MSEYAERDPVAQGDYYTRHVLAMTREGLRGKSQIAEELAFRDMEIARLNGMLSEKSETVVYRASNRQQELDTVREEGRKQGYQQALNEMKKQLEALQEKRRNL